jgi:D-glycero-D-manno-heptose 1,7-bisphosphate phosphatase
LTRKGLILLDRDGVLDKLVVDPDHGTIDSPLHPDQVEVYPWVPYALDVLCKKGYGLAIVTNQPAAAKGKTTRENLEKVHAKVVAAAESRGAKILTSHICYHRAEDGCECRKPKTGLLEDAFNRNPGFPRKDSWIVGDGLTDIAAGKAAYVKTAFIAPKKIEFRKVFAENGVAEPDEWWESLKEFAEKRE